MQQIKSIPTRGFSREEFESRAERARRLLTASRLDAVFVTTEANVRYFTGFDSQFWASPTRPWFVVVPRDGLPAAVIPEIGEPGMARTWIKDIRTWPAPRPEDDGVSLLADALSSVPRRFGRIGAELGHETHLRMPANDFVRVRETITPLEIVDATTVLRALRGVKSESEIEKIRHVCQITSAAYEALAGKLKLGDSERDACRKMRIDVLERGADDSPYLVGVSGQGGYDNIIMGPTDRMIGKGDILIIDTGTTFDGYYCDFDRNYAFGRPSDEARRAYEVVYRATDAGIAAAHPGATTTDVWRAMMGVLEAGGSLRNSVGRLGHGLGMQLTEWPSHKLGDDTEIVPGMVLTIEPGMEFMPGKMMVHEENIAVTAGGAELLTRRALPEMPVVT